jgi:hypothetical protein
LEPTVEWNFYGVGESDEIKERGEKERSLLKEDTEKFRDPLFGAGRIMKSLSQNRV